MDEIRFDLMDWLYLEIDRGQLDEPEISKVYYRLTDEDKAYQETLKSIGDVAAALVTLWHKLKEAYSDCAPLRQQLRRIEKSISIIEKAGEAATTAQETR